jgi:hypothetical protein
LRCLNWVFLIVYALAAIGIFWGELGTESPLYPEPFRFYYGVVGIPALLPIWFVYLIEDLIHGFRWQWLARSLGIAVLAIVGYFIVAAMTVIPG